MICEKDFSILIKANKSDLIAAKTAKRASSRLWSAIQFESLLCENKIEKKTATWPYECNCSKCKIFPHAALLTFTRRGTSLRCLITVLQSKTFLCFNWSAFTNRLWFLFSNFLQSKFLETPDKQTEKNNQNKTLFKLNQKRNHTLMTQSIVVRLTCSRMTKSITSGDKSLIGV